MSPIETRRLPGRNILVISAAASYGSAVATITRVNPIWVVVVREHDRAPAPYLYAYRPSEILDRPVEVISLSLRSVTPGRDSVGQVFLQARIGGKTMTGQGASTDIVEASARALVHSLNKERHAEVLEASSLNSVYLWGV